MKNLRIEDFELVCGKIIFSISVTRTAKYRSNNDDPAGWDQEATQVTSPRNHAIFEMGIWI